MAQDNYYNYVLFYHIILCKYYLELVVVLTRNFCAPNKNVVDKTYLFLF